MTERDIFIAALQKEDPAQRRAYLDGACAGQPVLRRQVEELLWFHEGAGSFLEEPAAVSAMTRAFPNAAGHAPSPEAPGALIGPYKLIEPIGEGGMGTVWMAQQTEPVRRLVAVKLIKVGMDSRRVIARFEAERQALALMDHANIARVLEAGTTGAGRPYFVMDLVKGAPITRYCDEHHLTPHQRLELFIPVCQAVQHAHQKGIIHRDLKPSNVLVALYDGQPVPKVIDFGVAKATGQQLTDKTLVTGFGSIVGTLEYMSPEQAEINQLDIDTRSDIYSLGVILYELLTGSTPFTKKDLEKAGMLEILRVIREQEPTKPSTKLSTAEGLPTLAANRGTEPARLMKMVRGELDWIVMKALEKDRTRRYETANGFAMDVQRYLADEPVLACPPSARYRLRKFARRNRRVLIAATAFILLLLTAVVTLAIAVVAVSRERQAKVAALEAEGKRRKQTRAALDAMSSQIIEDLLAKQPALLQVHEQFLERALHYYEEFASDIGRDEESRTGVADAFHRVGFIRERLGQFKDAEAAYDRSRELSVGLAADFPRSPTHRHRLGGVLTSLGNLYRKTGRTREAEKFLVQSVTNHRELAADYADVHTYRYDLARVLTGLGVLLKDLGRTKDAEEVYGQAVAIHMQLADEFPTEPRFTDALARAHGNLGQLLGYAKRSREAVESLVQAEAIYKRLAADFPTDPRYRDQLAICRNNLGDELLDAKRHLEAEETFRQSLTIRRQLVDEFPAVPEYRRGLAITLNNLGISLKNTGRGPEAEELYGQALTLHKRLAVDYPEIGNYQNETAGAMVNVARLLLARKELDGARRLLEEALPYHQAALKASPRHPSYRNFYRLNRWRLAETFLELKDHTAAAMATREFLQVAFEPPRDAYTAACLLAGCVRLAVQDERLDEIDRQELATAYRDSAMASLREAIEKGAKEVSQMTTDPSLDPLRSRQDFQQLLGGLEATRKP